MQSALGLNLRIAKAEKLPYRREILKLNDGGQLAVDFLGEGNEDEDGAEKDGKYVGILYRKENRFTEMPIIIELAP